MCKLPQRMATSSNSWQKQVPAEQGPNAIEHLLAGENPRPLGQPQQPGRTGRTGRLSGCPGVSIPAEREPGLERWGIFFCHCPVQSCSDRKGGRSSQFCMSTKHGNRFTLTAEWSEELKRPLRCSHICWQCFERLHQPSDMAHLFWYAEDFMQPVWLMCLSHGAERCSDHDLSWMTVTLPQPACASELSHWRQRTRRKFSGTKGNNTSGYTGQSLLKAKRQQKTELFLRRQPATMDPRKVLGKLLAWIDASSYHYHLPVLCFMTHSNTSFSLNQAHKCTQRWFALICSSPPAKGWVEVTVTRCIRIGIGRMSRETTGRLKPQTHRVLVIVLRHATAVDKGPCETGGATWPYRERYAL